MPKPSHSHTGLPAHSSSPSHVISPLLMFFDHFSLLSHVYSCKEPFTPIDPFYFPTHSISTMLWCMHNRVMPSSQTEDVCTCVPLFWICRLPQHTYCLFPHVLHANIMLSCASVTVLLMSCIYSKTWLCHNLSSSSHRFFLGFACERVGGAQHTISIATLSLCFGLWFCHWPCGTELSDHVPDPGCREQSFDTHSCIVLYHWYHQCQ